jgi:trans-feruloyl-CoA hydratase/vanillin synthase
MDKSGRRSEMKRYKNVKLKIEGDVATVTLNRPKKKNAMSLDLHREMTSALKEVEAAGEIKVLVLTGTGDSFCGGMDLEETFLEPFGEPKKFEAVHYGGLDWFEHLKAFPSVTVAKVNGWCFGGGLELVGICDLAIAAEEASFGLSEINFGIFPGGGAMWAVAHNMMRKQALYYSLTGERFNGIQAVELGLVNRAVPLADLDKETDRVVSLLVGKNYNALRSNKEVFEKTINMDFPSSKAWELAKTLELSYLTKNEWIDVALKQFKNREFRPGMQPYSKKKGKAKKSTPKKGVKARKG